MVAPPIPAHIVIDFRNHCTVELTVKSGVGGEAAKRRKAKAIFVIGPTKAIKDERSQGSCPFIPPQ